MQPVSQQLSVVGSRALRPDEIMFGAIWIAPGSGPRGNGDLPDPGQPLADATVAAALKAGIREFDTAPWYGAGSSEERLGRAITANSAWDKCKVTTKAGRLYRELDGVTPCSAGFDQPGRTPLADRIVVNDYTSDGARTSLRESSQRLGSSAIHGLRMHDPNDNSTNRRGLDGCTFVDEVAVALSPGGMCAGLRALRAEGIVVEVGLGMNCNREPHQGVPDEILRLLGKSEPGTFDSALLAGGWNLITQVGLPCFAECEAKGVAVHVAGVFGSGLLVGGETYAYKKAEKSVLDRVQQWKGLAAKHGRTLPSVAIAFSALPKCVTRVVLGLANPEQVRQTMGWVAESALVPAELWSEAKAAGLLGAEVPTPE